MQKEVFMRMTILKPSVYQIHGLLIACYKACTQIQGCQLLVQSRLY